MGILYISWKNVKKKGLSTFLSVLLIAFGVGLLSLLLQFNKQFGEQFERNQAGIDLVVGSKGSPLQLILNSMFHVDAPTGNISIKDAAFLFNPKNPYIKTAIPLSIGDSHKTFRIIGTTPQFLDLYGAKLGEGKLWGKPLEAVIGQAVAKETKLKIGSTFFSSHGFNEGDLEHDEGEPFIVTGILEPSGTVADKIILTSYSSIWEVHGGHSHGGHVESQDEEAHKHEELSHEGHDHEGHNHDGHDHEERASAQNKENAAEVNLGTPASSPIEEMLQFPEKEITSVLVKFHADKKRAVPVINMPRNINENTAVMATAPTYELNKLLANVGAVLKALSYLALLIAIISSLSIFISLFNNLKDRQYELAMMRVSGGSPMLLAKYIFCEALIIGFLGFVIGIFLAHISVFFISSMLDNQFHYNMNGFSFYKEEVYLGLATLLISGIAAIIPAIKAYQTDIIKSLQ